LRKPSFLQQVDALSLGSAIALAVLILLVVGRDYPLVGHDNRYYIPRLLDTDLHIRLNGMAIQWYTPSFGGGLPAFPNPQHLQFSLLQWFTYWIHPWASVQLAMVLYAVVGFLVFSRYLTGRVGLRREAAVLGAIFFVGNGFFIEHMIVGHVGFQMFPLGAVLLTALTGTDRRITVDASIVALTLAAMVFQAGIYLIVLLALSLFLTLPCLILIDPRLVSLRRLAAIAVIGIALAVAIAGAKIYAVQAFMQHFPREVSDVYNIGLARALAGFAAQLVGAMAIVPVTVLAGFNPAVVDAGYSSITGASVQVGMWELDTGLSPVLSVCLAIAVCQFLWRSRSFELPHDRERLMAVVAISLLAWVLVEATLARGLIYPHIKALPILRSLHVNHRVAAVFILPLAIAGARVIDRWQAEGAHRRAVAAAIAIALACPAVYLLLPARVHQRSFDVRPSIALAHEIRAGKTFDVETVADVPDADALALKASSYRPYEPLFGYGLETFAGDIRPGPVREVRDDHYNLTQPASLVFPEANGLRVFERIPAADREALDQFTARRQPDWRTPPLQKWLNGISLAALAGTLVLLAIGSRGSRDAWHAQRQNA